ncbi:hypothetical protein P7K49_008007 [Saguinus oedipus]|uniref:MADS-box domain-containing protein n=1 Tax=Saguinus oedipus TaxID=9490 RepID=A0ABQ9VWG8_SAGOE|nr:hypothetical protein P7K49_008007 [Saguinus oedipus]
MSEHVWEEAGTTRVVLVRRTGRVRNQVREPGRKNLCCPEQQGSSLTPVVILSWHPLGNACSWQDQLQNLLQLGQAYELSTLTGTQVLLLVASETGHVYTFATRKLQPMITSETGKALIQTCLNSPDSPPRSDPTTDQRMSATGFEETDLTYQVSESDSSGETKSPAP